MSDHTHGAGTDLFAQAAELDRQANEALNAHQASARAATTAAFNPAQQICEFYRRIRGVLVTASNFPLIPSGIRNILKELIRLLDALCGAGGGNG
jgi:predicted MarR family transcription regulator